MNNSQVFAATTPDPDAVERAARVLLLTTAHSYRAEAFVSAAERLGRKLLLLMVEALTGRTGWRKASAITLFGAACAAVQNK